MTNEGRDDTDGMERRDDEALWALLGRQLPPAKASPYLSRRVLREVARAEETRAAGWWGRVRGVLPGGTFARPGMRWSAALSSACAVALLVLTHAGTTPRTTRGREAETTLAGRTTAATPAMTTTPTAPAAVGPAVPSTPEAAPGVAPDDVEVIADLDNVLQREESRLWTEDTGRF